MKVIEKGHSYFLENFENKNEYQLLKFINKKVDENGDFKTFHDGITNEEIINVLIDRIIYLNQKHPCIENEKVLICLEDALIYLKIRTIQRENRNVKGKNIT